MKKDEIIKKTKEFVKGKLFGEGSGHDWWHVWRVWQLAKQIGQKEKADLFIIELAALLHDVADWKFQDKFDDTVGPMVAKEWLESLHVDSITVSKITQIIKEASFKGMGVVDRPNSIEGMIVQDADRLDAMGAIGIGRTFAYGGYKQREMYNPKIKVKMAKNFEEYKKAEQTTINHFYEKLLLLRDRMNTKTGKKLATKRHRFMRLYLKEFFDEWKGRS